MSEIPIFGANIDQATGLGPPQVTGAGLYGTNQDTFDSPVYTDVPYADYFTSEMLAGRIPPSSADISPEGTIRTTSTVGRQTANFAKLRGDELKALQQQLYDSGFYSAAYYRARNPKKLNFGSAGDSDTLTAFKKAIREAALSEQTLDEVLAGKAGVAGEYAAQQPKLQRVAEADLLASARRGFRNAVGRNPTDEEFRRFVAGWRGREETAFAQSTGEGGTVDRLPQPDDLAEQQVEETPEAQGFRMARIASAIYSTLASSSVGGAPMGSP